VFNHSLFVKPECINPINNYFYGMLYHSDFLPSWEITGFVFTHLNFFLVSVLVYFWTLFYWKKQIVGPSVP
ncbi:hypothetical protein VIGAN_06145900, partial [Vigna angularis var. angularis]